MRRAHPLHEVREKTCKAEHRMRRVAVAVRHRWQLGVISPKNVNRSVDEIDQSRPRARAAVRRDVAVEDLLSACSALKPDAGASRQPVLDARVQRARTRK